VPSDGRAARLHRNHTGGLASEKLQNLLASQPLTEDNLAGRIRPVRLKDVLRYARSKPIVLTSDTDASSVVTNTTTLAHQGRRGGVHPITEDCAQSCVGRSLSSLLGSLRARKRQSFGGGGSHAREPGI
jgi:hypothetical protein